MESPYLNSGEAIVLTTNRVSADAVLHDVMLTTERLFLIDNRYARFEPRIIPLATILSVQGGRTPAHDPVITLLFRTSEEAGAQQPLNLIFFQNPNENRKPERDIWVRNLIQLCIIQHDKAIPAAVHAVPEASGESGLRPMVRHGVPPEKVRPLSHVVGYQTAPPPVTVIPDEVEGEGQIPAPAAAVPPAEEERREPEPVPEEPAPDFTPVRGTPQHPPPPPARDVIPQIIEELLPAQITDAPPVRKRYTILVVDDSPFNVDVFVTMLERGGYHTVSAYGGEECLEILRTVSPDLILLDIMMEPVDGWQTLERIRENQATRETPVLMLTAKQLNPAETQEHGLSVDDYIPKPITHRELYDAIERSLTRRQAVKSALGSARQPRFDAEIISEDETTPAQAAIPHPPTAAGPTAVPETIMQLEIRDEENVVPEPAGGAAGPVPEPAVSEPAGDATVPVPESAVTEPAGDATVPVPEPSVTEPAGDATVPVPEPAVSEPAGDATEPVLEPAVSEPAGAIGPVLESAVSEPAGDATVPVPEPAVSEPADATKLVPEPAPESPESGIHQTPETQISLPHSENVVQESAQPAPEVVPGQETATAEALPVRHPAPPAREIRPIRTTIAYAAVLLLIALAVAGAILLLPQGPGGADIPVPSIPGITTVPPGTTEQPAVSLTPARITTPVPCLPASPVPQTGIWVRVNSTSNYFGAAGNAGQMQPVSATGDNFYKVPRSDRPVQVAVQKQDNSGAPLEVGIYRNGTLISTRSVTSPMGAVNLLIDPITARPPGLAANDTHATATTTYRLEDY